MSIITVDKSVITGKIKPVSAVNGVPTVFVRGEERWNWKRSDNLSLMGTTRVRLCEIGGAFGNCVFVDIPNLFPDFNADECDPASYDFTFTDWLIGKCVKYGVKPIYRLGVTREVDHWLKAYRIFPPVNFEKWARICEHIIMHYNKGWANGFKYGIDYWEIWNEPDDAIEIKDSETWKGTKEQYFELYKITATKIKNSFPEIKVGGYCAGLDGVVSEKPSKLEKYRIDFFNDFLDYVSGEEKTPLDFFTWHTECGSLISNVKIAEYVRERLDARELNECENICASWNISKNGSVNAAEVAANLITWQKSAVNMALYCDGTLSGKLFDKEKPSKSFYAMRAFNSLCVLKDEIYSESSDKDVYCLSASDGKTVRLMVVNYSGKEKQIDINLKDISVNSAVKLCLPAFGIQVLELI